jgi:hypothetical protein
MGIEVFVIAPNGTMNEDVLAEAEDVFFNREEAEAAAKEVSPHAKVFVAVTTLYSQDFTEA